MMKVAVFHPAAVVSVGEARSRKRYGSFWWYQTFILPDVNDRLWS